MYKKKWFKHTGGNSGGCRRQKINVSDFRELQVYRETLNANDIQEPPQSDSNFSISSEPHESKEFIWFCSTLYQQHLAQGLRHSRHLTNDYWTKECHLRHLQQPATICFPTSRALRWLAIQKQGWVFTLSFSLRNSLYCLFSFLDLLKWDSLRPRSKIIPVMVFLGWVPGMNAAMWWPHLQCFRAGKVSGPPFPWLAGPQSLGRGWEGTSCPPQTKVLSMFQHRGCDMLGVTHSPRERETDFPTLPASALSSHARLEN